MNFLDAYKAMYDGLRIASNEWTKHCFIKISNKTIVDECNKNYLPDKEEANGIWFIYNDSKEVNPVKDKMIDIDGKFVSLSTIKEALKNHIIL